MNRFLYKIIVSGIFSLSILQGYSRDHSTEPEHYWLLEKEAPSSLTILMNVPDTASARFGYDKEQYLWGKSLRETERGRKAIMDANLDRNSDWANDAFGEAFGVPITKEISPELYRLIYVMQEDAGDLATREAKDHYMRPRPFMMLNEPSATPSHEEGLRKNGSYPSGHTSIGWATALILAEINPERATQILKRGVDYGQSRVIVGAHWQSDVDAGRIAGAGIVSILHSNKAFRKQLEKAKKEFKKNAYRRK
ncbi:MAG: phosphatase PAP2 family protein [Bacteroidales bacterium]|nr:phosphatase PAP2 family protein [Bacteroidales bacterium]